MPHARTARARETAAVMRAALAAGRAADRPLDLGPTYAEPWLDNLRVSVDGAGVEAGTAVGDRLGLVGELPGWAVECDRFDSGHGPSKAAGGHDPLPRPGNRGCTARAVATVIDRGWL